MHKEHVESYREQLEDIQDRLVKLRLIVRHDLNALSPADRRHFAWQRINDRVSMLVDGFTDLRNDLLDLEPPKK